MREIWKFSTLNLFFSLQLIAQNKNSKNSPQQTKISTIKQTLQQAEFVTTVQEYAFRSIADEDTKCECFVFDYGPNMAKCRWVETDQKVKVPKHSSHAFGSNNIMELNDFLAMDLGLPEVYIMKPSEQCDSSSLVRSDLNLTIKAQSHCSNCLYHICIYIYIYLAIPFIYIYTTYIHTYLHLHVNIHKTSLTLIP